MVSTPIGNLEDITLRALRVLREVDMIAAEDTRHTRKLLSHYHISNRLSSYHSYNRKEKTDYLLRLLQEGKDIALVTDSGTPGISDPSFYLLKNCIERGIPLTTIPGPTALIAGLVLAGIPVDRFIFLGFLPAKKGRRRKLIESVRKEDKTVVFFESPHRIKDTLEDIEQIMGKRYVSVCRELTKKFEEVLRGTICEVREKIADKKKIGELVVVVAGKGEKIAPLEEDT